VRIAYALAEIKTRYLLHTNLES